MATYRNDEVIRTVAAIGAGVIGSGWAAAFLGHGCAVRLHDPEPAAAARAKAHIASAWPQMVALGLARDGDDWASRLSCPERVEQAVESVDFVQESTPERNDLKKALLARLDSLLPREVIIATSTSSLAVTELQAGLLFPERIVLGHPFNPVHLTPLVEVGGGEGTDPAAIEAARAFYCAMGKKPIRLQREIFGHIANRLTSAMLREAVRLVGEGYASVADVDDAVRYGPAIKWAIQGPFTTSHTSGGPGGLADFLDKFGGGIMKRWETMADSDLADPELRARLVEQMAEAAAGRTVAEIARRQDELLMRAIALLTPPTLTENDK